MLRVDFRDSTNHNHLLEVQLLEIQVLKIEEDDYIYLTDMVRKIDN